MLHNQRIIKQVWIIRKFASRQWLELYLPSLDHTLRRMHYRQRNSFLEDPKVPASGWTARKDLLFGSGLQMDSKNTKKPEIRKNSASQKKIRKLKSVRWPCCTLSATDLPIYGIFGLCKWCWTPSSMGNNLLFVWLLSLRLKSTKNYRRQKAAALEKRKEE